MTVAKLLLRAAKFIDERVENYEDAALGDECRAAAAPRDVLYFRCLQCGRERCWPAGSLEAPTCEGCSNRSKWECLSWLGLSLPQAAVDAVIEGFNLGYVKGHESGNGPLNRLATECHAANQTWWHDPKTGERVERNIGEMIALMHSELSEALEGERKNLMDKHLPHRRAAEVELADLLIRVFDYCGAKGYDLDGAVAEKRAYNATREDHKPEARLRPDGKRF